MDVPIAVGTADTPTPGGTYYVKELLRPAEPDGAYGPYAYGLSGFSNVLDDLRRRRRRDRHPRHERPEAIGRDVSHGCIRLPNEDHRAARRGPPAGHPGRDPRRLTGRLSP